MTPPNALNAVRDSLRTGLLDDVTRAELLDVNARVAALDADGTRELIDGLDDGALGRWGAEMHEEARIGLFGEDGLRPGERADVLGKLAADLDAPRLARVHDALATPERRAELDAAVERRATLPVREAYAEARRDLEVDESVEAGLDRAGLERLAATEDAPRLAELSAALGPESSRGLADAVAAVAPGEVRAAYVAARLDAAGESERRVEFGAFAGTTVRDADPAARDAAAVAASLEPASFAATLGALSPPERRALFAAAADPTARTPAGFGGGYVPAATTVDVDAVGRLAAAAGRVDDPELRAAILGDAAIALEAVGVERGIEGDARAALGRDVLRALGPDAVAALPPGAVGPLAAGLTADPALGGPRGDAARDALAGAFGDVAALPPSPARDVLARTLLAKVPGGAFERSDALASAASDAAVASSPGGVVDPAAAADRVRRTLGTEAGRDLLAGEGVHPGARLWALDTLVADPSFAADVAAAGRAGSPAWESAAVLERHAAARVEQHALGRADAAAALVGSQVANYVGISAGARPRDDVPADASSVAGGLADGTYDLYRGNEDVQRVATGIEAVRDDLGTAAVHVAAVPIQFSSAGTGPIDLTVYRVGDGAGRERIVDNVGRTYDSVADWVADNDLPPGQVTYPDGLRTGDGATPAALSTSVTPNVRDTAWEHVAHWGDYGALALGVVASGVIIAGSFGTATPLVGAAWVGAAGAAAWTTGRAAGTLADRHAHDQSLSIADPEARAAWAGVAGGGLTLAGGGFTALAARAANGTASAVQLARLAGATNVAANYADGAATLDQAHSTWANWDRMSGAQRAESLLGVAFWGATTGASVRMNGGRFTDVGFGTSVRRAMIETGAAVRVDPTMAPGTATVRVRPDADAPASDPLRGVVPTIRHAPDASPETIRAHVDAAHALIANGGIEGATRRLLGRGDAYPAGSFGETTVIEVVKHEFLLADARGRASDASLPPAARELAARDVVELEHALDSYRQDLEAVRASPEHALAPGPDSIDVKRPSAYRVGRGEPDLPRTAAADLPLDRIADPALAARFPDAVPVTLADLGPGFTHTLSSGEVTAKAGGHGSSDLRKVLRPVDQGGWGGAVFHDPATDAMIVAVNIRTNRAPGVLDRVEVAYARDANGEWRADFSGVSAYSTSIDPTLPKDYQTHFEAANQRLSEALIGDPNLDARLGLSPAERGLVDAGEGASPKPYTWHHVDGGGGMQLIDEAIHSFFPHYGGFSEWSVP